MTKYPELVTSTGQTTPGELVFDKATGLPFGLIHDGVYYDLYIDDSPVLMPFASDGLRKIAAACLVLLFTSSLSFAVGYWIANG